VDTSGNDVGDDEYDEGDGEDPGDNATSRHGGGRRRKCMSGPI
jgi:hypothetical protein